MPVRAEHSRAKVVFTALIAGFTAIGVGRGAICTTCHMEQTPPPDLLAYNLGGTNHGFALSTRGSIR
jgi:hypothetical protein